MSYKIIPQTAEEVKGGFWFPAELAEYIEGFDPCGQLLRFRHAVRYALTGESKECYAELEDIIDGSQKKKRFVKPSVEEVREYCNERRNRVDPEAFVDFYASKGWKVGKEPMKDWRAAVRTWERRDRGEGENTGGSFDTDEFFAAAVKRTYDK